KAPVVIRKWLWRSALKQINTQLPKVTSERWLVLYDADIPYQQAFALAIVQRRGDGLCSMYGFSRREDQTNPLVFTKKSLQQNLLPPAQICTEVASNQFDVVVQLSPICIAPLHYLAAAANSSLKVGINQAENNDLYQ